MTKFKCIMADPPWSRSDGNAPCKPRLRGGGVNAPVRFPTMRIAAIRALPVEQLAADRAHLWIWSLNSTLEQAYTVVRAWGFSPRGIITWQKTRRTVGTRMYFYHNTEQLIFAVRGTPAILPRTPGPQSCYSWPVSAQYARKPEDSYRLIEQISIGPRLELFARRKRPGWEAWGNEIRSTVRMPS